MARPSLLDETEIAEQLAECPDWTRDGDHLRRTFSFNSFVEAMGFMMSSGLVAERLNHHPEWTNVYNRVDVGLTTHDAGGLTELDFALAAQMSKLAT